MPDPDSTFQGSDTRNNLQHSIPRKDPALASGRFPTRQPNPITANDVEQAPMKHIALALIHLRQALDKIPPMLVDQSRPVDAFTPQGLVSEAETTILVQPNWEGYECITSILVVGPPAGVCQLQLGDRTIPLVIPATGVVVIAPISMRLSRADVRQLTTATPGQYMFELMGHADSRGVTL